MLNMHSRSKYEHVIVSTCRFCRAVVRVQAGNAIKLLNYNTS